MKPSRAIIMNALVRPWYRQNASLFLFIIILLFTFNTLFALYPLQYQYHLILGMLTVPAVLIGVFLFWGLYTMSCSRHVTRLLRDPRYRFLHTLYLTGDPRAYRLLLEAQLWLSLPISSYSLIVSGVAIYRGWYGLAVLVPGYILICCLLAAWASLAGLHHPGRTRNSAVWRSLRNFAGPMRRQPYWYLFIRYMLHERKALFLGVKLVSCSALYLLLRDLEPSDYEIRMPLLFYSFGLFAHGMLIYHFRELELTRLFFYRGLPVPTARRVVQMAILFLLILIPEFVVIVRLAEGMGPASGPLHRYDAILLAVYSYGLLLFLYAALKPRVLSRNEYLRLIFILFLVQFGFVLAGWLAWLTGIFAAYFIFVTWRFDKSV